MNEEQVQQVETSEPAAGSAPSNAEPGPAEAQMFAAQKIAQVIDSPNNELTGEAMRALPNAGTPEYDYMMKLLRYE